MGHLTLMSEDIISTLPEYVPALRIVLSQTAPVPDWEEYVTGRFSETKQKDTSLLGGGKPVVAPGAARMVARMVDEAEDSSTNAPDPDEGSSRGEFRRATGSRPTRESSADFGPLPIRDDEDDDDGASAQVSHVPSR
jgi:serine/threonine-protein phosphatase 6 regulatory subunit 3